MDSQDRQPAATVAHDRWSAQARAAVDRLSALNGPTETAFLDIGDRMRQAHETSRNLTVMANALAGRLAEPEFQETLRGLDGALTMVDGLRKRKEDRGDTLAAITSAAQAIRSSLGALAQAMTHVNVLGMNAKIEAAQMTSSGIDFSIFTLEIVRLAGRGRQTLDRVLADLTRLEGAAAEAGTLQRSFETTHLAELTAVGDRLGESIRAMRQREREAAKALERLPRTLEDGATRIAGIVNGLQFGDITRQRLEHVDTALEALAGVLSGRTRFDDLEIPAADVPAFVGAVCGLQADQLEHIEQEFSGKTRQVMDNLKGLADVVGAIKASTESVYSSGVDGGSTFLLAVDHDLEKVAGVVAHYGEATRRTEESLGGVVEAAHAMAQAMKAIGEIDADMNLLGLNASIKCGNMGTRGRALNVVAQELRVYARQTRSQTHTVTERLHGVIATAEGLSSRNSGGDVRDLESLKESLDTWVAQLRQSGGETAWVLSQIQEQSGKVVSAMQAALADFDVLERTRSAVRDTVRELRTIADEATPGLPKGQVEEARRRLLTFLESHYTMDSERHVHSGAVAALLGEGGAPAAAGGEVDLSDVLF